MNFKQMIEENKFSLVVSLPSNSLELAKGALDGGAQALKVHCNVCHRASGHTFGTFAENRKFLQELIELCGDVPVGLVPGADEAFISCEEREEMEQMGVKFFSSYIKHLPCHMMESKVLTKMPAIDDSYTQSTLDAIRHSEIDILECSVQPSENYGTNLNYADILLYSDIVEKTGKPCLIPTQRNIKPEDVKYLYKAGRKALMIGAVVLGKDPEPEEVKAVTAAFREAMNAL